MSVNTDDNIDDKLPVKRGSNVQNAFDHGSKDSIGTTAVQLSETSIPANNGVLIKADKDNSGTVYVGNSGITAGNSNPTTDGFPLDAGETLFLEIDNANKIYLRADTTAQVVSFILT